MKTETTTAELPDWIVALGERTLDDLTEQDHERFIREERAFQEHEAKNGVTA